MRRQDTNRRSRFAVLLLVAVGITFGLPLFVPMTTANSQERIIRRSWSLFDVFAPRRPSSFVNSDRQAFPSSPRAPKAVAKQRKPKTRAVARKSAAETEPAIAAVEKLPEARTVLVIGDFLASGMAEGLDELFGQEARVRILDRSKGASGFVRADVYNWPTEITALIDAEKPAAIAIMIGSNDRQPMRVGDKREAVRTDTWTNAYVERADALSDAIEAKKVPFVWIGMPSFSSTKMTSDMLAFNDIYKHAAEEGKGEFIDIWDGFADETGAYVASGPDIAGQPVRLRAGDGINMTRAGKAKLAFFVEKPLRKLLGLTAPDQPGLPSAVLTPQSPALPAAVDRTEPMSLNDPNLDGATELLGATVATDGPVGAASITAGQPAPAGRADNFLVPAPNADARPAQLSDDDATSTAAR